MRLCGIDIETTGLDHANDHVTEIAWVIKEVGDPKPLVAKTHFVLPPENMWDSPDYIKPNIEQLTKIKMKHVMAGIPLDIVLHKLHMDCAAQGVTYVMAHNGEGFDRPFLRAKAAQMKCDFWVDTLPWIDTSVDIVYPEDCRHTNLLYVSAYHGFLNFQPHSALFDVMTMFKVAEHYDMEAVAARAAIPWLVVQACVSFADKDLAKARRYYWQTLGDKTYDRKWVKRVKECDLEKERAECGFPIAVLGA